MVNIDKETKKLLYELIDVTSCHVAETENYLHTDTMDSLIKQAVSNTKNSAFDTKKFYSLEEIKESFYKNFSGADALFLTEAHMRQEWLDFLDELDPTQREKEENNER